jgi:hypothetical protein
MPDILFIKTSSLGDVIHHIPALTPSTWRDIASFGRAVLARRYDDTRSAWRCEYWFLRRPERRSHARGQVPRYEKERSLGADTIRGMPITSNLFSEEFRGQDHATRGKPGWMQSLMIQSWRILEPRNLTLLFPIRDAAPMSAAGFAGVAIEAAILNYIIGHADPLVIE